MVQIHYCAGTAAHFSVLGAVEHLSAITQVQGNARLALLGIEQLHAPVEQLQPGWSALVVRAVRVEPASVTGYQVGVLPAVAHRAEHH